jgi:hypothetical protein
MRRVRVRVGAVVCGVVCVGTRSSGWRALSVCIWCLLGYGPIAVPLCAGLFVLGRVARGCVRPPCASGACWVTAHCAVVSGVVCVGTRRSGLRAPSVCFWCLGRVWVGFGFGVRD